MKFQIKQNVLMEHLNYAIRGISNKNIIPILNCIKFDLTSNGLSLVSTDNEITIKTVIPNNKIDKIDEEGSIVVSGKFIYEIIKKLPNEIINIEEVIDNKLYITTNNSSFTLNTNLINDYPTIELEEGNNPIILNKKVFKTIINQVAFATSNQESRPVLTGINFNININKNIMECVATDSYRLSKKIVELNENINEDINITIPNRALQELIKIFNDDDDNIEIHIFSNKVLFKFNSIIFMTKILNGAFPNTNQLLPNVFELEIKCNFNELYNAIDRASLLTTENDKNIINLKISNDEVVISSNIPEIGNVKEVVMVNKNNDNDINISFSAKYMLDALKAINSLDVVLKFNGEIKPIIIEDVANDKLIELVLPIRTD